MGKGLFLVFLKGMFLLGINVSCNDLKTSSSNSMSKLDEDFGLQKEHEEQKFGPGKSIVEVHRDEGFRLSEDAFNNMNIKLKKIDAKLINLPKTSLVISKSQKAIYRYRKGFFKLVTINIISETPDMFQLEIGEFLEGDQIAIGGLGLLKIADVFSKDSSNYGHSH